MESCRVFQTDKLLGKRWTLVLLQEIVFSGKNGFNALQQRLIKVSPKVLSQRLKELEGQGLLIKEMLKKERPYKTAYTLTDKGKGLLKIVKGLKRWHVSYNQAPDECVEISCVECEKYLN